MFSLFIICWFYLLGCWWLAVFACFVVITIGCFGYLWCFVGFWYDGSLNCGLFALRYSCLLCFVVSRLTIVLSVRWMVLLFSLVVAWLFMFYLWYDFFVCVYMLIVLFAWWFVWFVYLLFDLGLWCLMFLRVWCYWLL